ncbi:hypothetical protein [Iodobacter fluviatilis]|nr:hypothetical protein [Iodobacter fluviatilis]
MGLYLGWLNNAATKAAILPRETVVLVCDSLATINSGAASLQ